MTTQTRPGSAASEQSRQDPLTIPSFMEAAAIDRFGDSSMLTLHKIPVPSVGPSEVLIEVHAAGIGIWDSEIRSGTFPPEHPKFPLVLGVDGAGVVVKKGESVKRFEVGDHVWAYSFDNPKGGFYAEYVAVNEENVGRMPGRLDFLHAGAAAVTALTAYQGIEDHLRLQSTETVLIFGGSGAVGTLAIQFAKRKGARVIATATGEEAQALVQQLGANAVIDGRSPHAAEKLRKLAPEGLTAVFALAGGASLSNLLNDVLSGGRVVYPNGVEPPTFSKEIEAVSYDAAVNPSEFERLESAIAEEGLHVPLAGAFTLSEASRAHSTLENDRVLGRLAFEIKSVI